MADDRKEVNGMFDYGICDGQVYVDGSFQKSNLYIKDEKLQH